jgi:hypothetical protein
MKLMNENVEDVATGPRPDSAIQIIRCIILAALVAAATWLIANSAIDWMGFR